MGSVKLLFLFSWILAFSSTDVYQHRGGAHNPGDYSGHDYPEFQIFDNNQSSFLDKPRNERYFFSLTSDDLLEKLKFLRHDLKDNKQCSVSTLSAHKDDLRFSFRALSLSYLFEGLEKLGNIERKLDLPTKSCQVNWPKELLKCDSRSKKMERLKDNLSIYFSTYEHEKIAFDFSLSKQRNLFYEALIKGDGEYGSGVLQSECSSKCSNLQDLESLAKKVKSKCEQLKTLFSHICQEKDEYRGLTTIREPLYLLRKSSYNDHLYPRGCFDRYATVNKKNELKPKILSNVFTSLYSDLKKDKNHKGRLFIYASLDKFYEQGIVVLNKVKKEEIFVVRPPVVAKSNPIVSKKTVKVVRKKMKKIVKEKIQKILKKEVKKIERKYSSFYQAVVMFDQSRMNTYNLDMNQFSYDYLFEKSDLKILTSKLVSFASYKALQTMKKQSQLGSSTAPFPLLFIKFLIDQHHFKEIYNIMNVVGDSFYVFNDIDELDQRQVQKINLSEKFDLEHSWLIKLIR